MRRPVAVLTCLSLLLAGCGATAPAGEDPRTVNPALRETPTASPTPEATRLPPGVSETEVDLRTLLSAHRTALSGRSVTVAVSRTRTTTNGTAVFDATTRSYADPPAQFVESHVVTAPYDVAGGAGVDTGVWRNDTVTVRRSATGDGDVSVVYDTEVPRQQVFDPTGASEARGILGPYTLAPNGTVVRNGTRYHRLVDAQAGHPVVPLRSNVSVRVLATPDGVIRSATVRYRTTEYEEPMLVTVRFRVSNVSATTVPRPPWVDEALANGS